jgi:hypothetical protein
MLVFLDLFLRANRYGPQIEIGLPYAGSTGGILSVTIFIFHIRLHATVDSETWLA